MRPAGVPERVRYDPKSFNLPDLMFDPDTKPAQPLVVFLFLFHQLAAFRLLIRIIDGFAFLVVALIRAVAIRPCALGQPRTRAANGEVMAAAGVGWRNAGDPAILRHDILALQRVALLLAGVMPLLNRVRAETRGFAVALSSGADFDPRRRPRYPVWYSIRSSKVAAFGQYSWQCSAAMPTSSSRRHLPGYLHCVHKRSMSRVNVTNSRLR